MVANCHSMTFHIIAESVCTKYLLKYSYFDRGLLKMNCTEITDLFMMHFLHDVREMNAYRTGHVCLSARLNSITGGLILIKYDTDFMPLKTIIHSYFLISYSR
jgi:hypothetical protein